MSSMPHRTTFLRKIMKSKCHQQDSNPSTAIPEPSTQSETVYYYKFTKALRFKIQSDIFISKHQFSFLLDISNRRIVKEI